MNYTPKIILILLYMFCSAALHAQQIIPLPDTTHLSITINNSSIYNDSILIGNYKQKSIDTDLVFLQVYNCGHSRVAEVTHEQGTATWTIVTPVDQKRMYAPYNAGAPLASLFRHLVLKGYL